MAWLGPLGVLLIALGLLNDIALLWREHGLTRTTYRALVLLAAGEGVLVLFAGWLAAESRGVFVAIFGVMAALSLMAALLFVGLVWLKLTDYVRSGKWSAAVRRQTQHPRRWN